MRSAAASVSACVLTSLVSVFGVSQAHAWGAHGHQIVSYVGADVAGQEQPFWSSNVDQMRTLSTVPDRVWKDSRTKADESPTHWFQADAYVQDINQCDDILKFPRRYDDAVNEYGEATIIRNGTAPYRVVQMYNLALAAFRRGDMETAVEDAGIMSHYIGDLSQPLHVSENYDGKETGNSGIHSWFETKNLGNEKAIRKDVLKRAEALRQDPAFIAESAGDLADIINHEIVRSLEKRDEVLQNDSKYGRQSAKAKSIQLDLAEDRMADGAAVLAVVLERLARDAGLSRNATAVPVEDPKWIAPDYDSSAESVRAFADRFTTPLNPAFELEDDCGAL